MTGHHVEDKRRGRVTTFLFPRGFKVEGCNSGCKPGIAASALHPNRLKYSGEYHSLLRRGHRFFSPETVFSRAKNVRPTPPFATRGGPQIRALAASLGVSLRVFCSIHPRPVFLFEGNRQQLGAGNFNLSIRGRGVRGAR